MRGALSVLVSMIAIAACASSDPRPRPITGASAVPAEAPAPSAPSASVPVAQGDPPAPKPLVGAPLAATFHREVEGRVTHVALEKPPHAAALGRSVLWIREATGWHSEPLPKTLTTDPAPSLSLFFGRDFKVRVTGSRPDDPSAEAIYLRWRGGKLDKDKAEIGRLGGAPGPLVAILGTADPEIVCRPGDICIVKSVKGWLTVNAPPDIARVTIGEGRGWGIAGRALLTLDGEWRSAGPEASWASADAIFATAREAWVVETAADAVHAFDGSRWRVLASPITRPRAIWGTSREALWIVGDGGLAYFDGSEWHAALDAPRPLSTIAGRGAEDVWVGGEAGLFRVERTAPSATRSSGAG